MDRIDEEYCMPCVEALLAGTLALMTGHLQACCDGHREAMAAKIASNLAQLAGHPMLTPPFRAMLASLHTRWDRPQATPSRIDEQADQRLWHSTPTSVQ